MRASIDDAHLERSVDVVLEALLILTDVLHVTFVVDLTESFSY